MLDLNTLRLISMVSFLGFAFSTTMLWHLVPQERSLKGWSLASALLAVSMLLLGLRGIIPDFASIVVANTLAVLGVGLMYLGAARLFASKQKSYWHWIAALAAFIICLLSPTLAIRVTGISTLFVPFLFATATQFWRNDEPHLTVTKRFAGLIFAIGGILFTYRAFNPPKNIPNASAYLSTSSWIEAMPYVYVIIFSMWIPLILLLIVSVRLQRQRSEALELTEAATQELKESEFRWKFAIEGSGDGVWDWNILTDEVHYSKRWKEMLGYSDTEIFPANQEWVDRIHPDDQVSVTGAMESYLEGKTESYLVEYRLKCKDESYKWILGRGMVVERNEAGKPLRMIGTHTDT